MDDLQGPTQKKLTLSDWWTAFIAINSTATRWSGPLRAALAILIPGSIAMLTGHKDAILLICAGAFTVIYGEGIVYRKRWKVMLTAGALLWTGATVGALVGALVFAPGHGHAWLLLTAVYVAVLGAGIVFVQNALRLPPPGGFFIVMVTGGSTMLARSGTDPLEAA
ncbi:MAG TPA: FUSC family protein, partial [Corynebacterium stationis]|nr:FUSC family protein [Corynebacterium stationis]